MFITKLYQWLDLNCRPLVMEATALPTEPQLLPTLLSVLHTCDFWVSICTTCLCRCSLYPSRHPRRRRLAWPPNWLSLWRMQREIYDGEIWNVIYFFGSKDFDQWERGCSNWPQRLPRSHRNISFIFVSSKSNCWRWMDSNPLPLALEGNNWLDHWPTTAVQNMSEVYQTLKH